MVFDGNSVTVNHGMGRLFKGTQDELAHVLLPLFLPLPLCLTYSCPFRLCEI